MSADNWLWLPIGLAVCIGIYELAFHAVGLIERFTGKRHRPKPDNYVGKFRQPDGTIIHIARMASGRLWAASDTQPPVEVGYVDGRDVARWEKLATTPDG